MVKTMSLPQYDGLPSILVRANSAFRGGLLEEAILLYRIAVNLDDGALRNHARFNLGLALKRLEINPANGSKLTYEIVSDIKKSILRDNLNDNNEAFLGMVYEAALGRSPEKSEKDHYLSTLEENIYDRKKIINIIFGSEEAARNIYNYANKNVLLINRKHPKSGEILPENITLPIHHSPQVTVLIPVYGKVEYTLACLKSIADNPPVASIEVIVLDDRSPDDSFRILQRVKNLRVIVNSENLGFLRSCNHGARSANGEYIFFLNNDTQVKPGWLDEQLSTFNNFLHCGLTGSKLVYPDGRLQEAGGIIWQDGSAWNYGRYQDPALPQYNYAREVDYISGAAIMVSSKLFDELGGFDDRYAPAYYEDTDLAMRIRAHGLRVIYQPLSEVVHYEGVTSGTDTSHGVKAYQYINGEKFLKKWQHALTKHRPNGIEPQLERDRNAVGRVLFIDACTPTPDQDSGSIDIFNLMKVFLGMGWAVTFIPEDNYAYIEKYTAALQRLGVQMLYHPHIKSVDEHISQQGRSYDLVMSFRPMVTAKHVGNIREKCPNAKIIFNTVDLHFLRMEREAILKNDSELLRSAQEMKADELSLMARVDLTTVVSSVELEILRGLGVERIVHLPFSRQIQPSKVTYAERSGLIFVGGFQHTPNVDAIQYFVADVMPKLRVALPGIILNIVGSNTPQEIKDLAQGDIIVHGFVENIQPLLDAARVNIAPLRYGAGTKGKVVQAMAVGLPTVGTQIAFEGMGIDDGIAALIADSPDDLCRAVIDLYNSEEKWAHLASNGLKLVNRFFGIEALDKRLRAILRE